MGSLLRDENPGPAIAAASGRRRDNSGVHTDRVVMDIVDRNHELRTIALNFDYPGKCEVMAMVPRQFCVSMARNGYRETNKLLL